MRAIMKGSFSAISRIMKRRVGGSVEGWMGFFLRFSASQLCPT